MFHYIGIVIVFLCCTFIGYYLGEAYKRRYIQLDEFLKAILLLNNEVIYSHTPLPEAFNNVALKIKTPIRDLFVNISNDLSYGKYENVYNAFYENIILESNNIVLEEEDKSILEHFFKNIGESLTFGQDKIFSLTIDQLKKNCNKAERLYIQNTKMFRRVGICIGAIAAIFLI